MNSIGNHIDGTFLKIAEEDLKIAMGAQELLTNWDEEKAKLWIANLRIKMDNQAKSIGQGIREAHDIIRINNK